MLIVLIDDAGFASSSAFGGPINTPAAERLAAEGLRYNRFHTTALCSPTRSALLTGRNHHTVGMGSITELATSAPGYTSIWPDSCAPLAMTQPLSRGTEVTILELRDAWARVRVASGVSGWIPAGALERVTPST